MFGTDAVAFAFPYSLLAAITAFMLIFGELLLLAVRMHFLLPQGRRPTVLTTSATFFRAQLLNNFTLAGVGDIYKVNGLAKSVERPLSPAHRIGIVALDKILEFGALVTLCMIGCRRLSPLNYTLESPWIRSLSLAVFAIFIFFGASALKRPRLYSKSVSLLKSIVENITPSVFIVGFMISLVAWILELLAILFLCSKFSITLSQGMLILATLNLGSLLPSPVGKIGVYEGAMVLGLSQVGIPLAPALKIAATLHLFLLSNVVFGSLLTLRAKKGVTFLGNSTL